MSRTMRLFAALAALLLSAAPAAARLPQTGGTGERVPFGQGTHAFRAMFRILGATPVDSPEQLLDHPERKILVVLGRTDVLDRWLENHALREEFLRKGGAVFIATDRRTSDEMYDVLGAQVSGQFLTVPRDPGIAWRGIPECSLIQEVPGGAAHHPIFEGLPDPPRVATNKPSFLSKFSIPPIAKLPIDGNEGPAIDNETIQKMFRRSVPLKFAVARQYGQGGGRLLVLADHSVFINEMLLQPDNDNWQFAENIARWLSDDGKRSEILFYEDGVQRTDFEVSLKIPEPQMPPVEAIIPIVNHLLTGLERENAFNRMFLQMFDNSHDVLRTALKVLTLLLLLVGLYRFLHARHRTEAKVPRLPAQLAALAPPVPALEQRHQAVLARGNLSEAARELARQTFTALGVPPDAAAPEVRVAGSWWQRLVWGRRVRRLWELALGRTGRVSPAGLRRLAARLHELRAAAAGGKLHFAAAK